MGRLSEKVAFITGTANGQGRAAALLFAREGAVIVGCDLKVEEAEETAAMVREAGGTMLSSTVDLGDPEAVRHWIDGGVEATGGLDILYNNASAPRFGMIDDFSVEDWKFTIRNELDLVFYAIKAAWPHLKARGGVVINTSSMSTRSGNVNIGLIGHIAAKAGVIALTRQVAAEGAAYGIRANSISPGAVTSPGSSVIPKERAAQIAKAILLERWGEPDDIAQCALYLASDEAKWVTAADFEIAGGGNVMR